jgi:hypothetical protein
MLVAGATVSSFLLSINSVNLGRVSHLNHALRASQHGVSDTLRRQHAVKRADVAHAFVRSIFRILQ